MTVWPQGADGLGRFHRPLWWPLTSQHHHSRRSAPSAPATRLADAPARRHPSPQAGRAARPSPTGSPPPAGCVINAVSRPFEAAQGSQCGRSRWARIAAVNDGYDPLKPSPASSSCSVEAHRCGSSASRSRQNSRNGSVSVGSRRTRTSGTRRPSRQARMVLRSWPRCRAIAEIVQPCSPTRALPHLPPRTAPGPPAALLVITDQRPSDRPAPGPGTTPGPPYDLGKLI